MDNIAYISSAVKIGVYKQLPVSDDDKTRYDFKINTPQSRTINFVSAMLPQEYTSLSNPEFYEYIKGKGQEIIEYFHNNMPGCILNTTTPVFRTDVAIGRVSDPNFYSLLPFNEEIATITIDSAFKIFSYGESYKFYCIGKNITTHYNELSGIDWGARPNDIYLDMFKDCAPWYSKIQVTEKEPIIQLDGNYPMDPISSTISPEFEL